MKKAIILKAYSQYGALRTFSDEVAKGLEELGWQCTVLDLIKETDELNDNLDKIEGCDFIFTFNGIAVTSQSFAQYINSKNKTVINFYVDHPYYHAERLNSGINHCIDIFAWKSCIASAKLLSNTKNGLIAYIPHGGLKPEDFSPLSTQFESRKNRILFSGSSNVTDSERPWSDARPSDQLCDVVYDEMLAGNGFEEAFDIAEKKVGLSPSGHLDLNLRKIVFSNVVPYLRARNRYDTIRQLVKSGVPVDIYGDEGWASVAQVLGVNYKGMLAMDELVNKFQEYKFVVNDCCVYPGGGHERIVNILLSGAYPISHDNYFLTNLKNDNYLSFNSENIETLSDRVKHIDRNNLFDATLDNFEFAKQHQWNKRSKDIVDLYELYSALNS